MRAAVELPGGGARQGGEAEAEYLWRCGALHNAALATMPLLQRAVDAGAAHCNGKRYAAYDTALAALLAAQLGARLREVASGRAQVSGPVDRVSAFPYRLEVTHG